MADGDDLGAFVQSQFPGQFSTDSSRAGSRGNRCTQQPAVNPCGTQTLLCPAEPVDIKGHGTGCQRVVDLGSAGEQIDDVVLHQADTLYPAPDLRAVLLDPHQLRQAVHGSRRHAGLANDTLRPHQLCNAVTLVCASGVGVQHGGQKRLVLFVQQHEGFPEAGNTDAPDLRVLCRRLPDNRFHGVGNCFRVHLML